MRGVFLLAFFGVFLFYGLFAPFALGLGYVWVDLLTPQRLAFSLIRGTPVSMVMAAATIGMYLLADRKYPPKPSILHLLLIVFAIWITMTTTWAVLPERAWIKWDWAFKSLVFAAFIPFLFRTRIQIEAFLWVFILCVFGFSSAVAAKTLVGSGGYGIGPLIEQNHGLSESSTVTLIATMLIPILLHFRKNSLIFKPGLTTDILIFGIILAAVLTTMGTAARTGLIALAALAGLLITLQKHRIAYFVSIGVTSVLIFILAPQDWQQRMLTIADYQADSSASFRIGVWKWTYDYARENPLGGGFDVYQINTIRIELKDTGQDELVYDEWSRTIEKEAKAFHSIYFEVLGEHGFVGLGIFLAIVTLAMLHLLKIRTTANRERAPPWVASLSTAMMVSIGVFLAGGAFVGIAFQPYLYYMIAITIALKNNVRRQNIATR